MCDELYISAQATLNCHANEARRSSAFSRRVARFGFVREPCNVDQTKSCRIYRKRFRRARTGSELVEAGYGFLSAWIDEHRSRAGESPARLHQNLSGFVSEV